MEMIPVKSSNLRSVGYDQATGTLEIQFNSGTYEYSNVPSSIHTGLMAASSKGSYHHRHIKHAFSYRKIH